MSGPDHSCALILDIDGVLVPLGGSALEDDWGEWVVHPDRSDLVVAPRMIAAIDALNADVHWLTSWAANANSIVCPFVGWTPRPTFDKRTVPRWWKLDAVAGFMTGAPYERIAWVDDDLDHYDDVARAALDNHLTSGRLMLLAPDRSAGLTAADLAVLAAHLSPRNRS